jgi:von Willebrand factor A domain-containing protein 7
MQAHYFLGWLLLFSQASAFFPTKVREGLVGNSGVSHEQQTEDVFELLAQKYFPEFTNALIAQYGKPLTKKMIAARDDIAKANIEVDKDQNHSEKHFDGENFVGGQSRLLDLKGQVVSKLQGNDAAGARESLGQALHTLQDFYSHR